jgi:hypothetical protein
MRGPKVMTGSPERQIGDKTVHPEDFTPLASADSIQLDPITEERAQAATAMAETLTDNDRTAQTGGPGAHPLVRGSSFHRSAAKKPLRRQETANRLGLQVDKHGRKTSAFERFNNHGFFSARDTSGFTDPSTYDLPCTPMKEGVRVSGQMTAKMLLATPNRIQQGKSTKKMNLFLGVKLLTLLDIDAAQAMFKCRIKMYENWVLESKYGTEIRTILGAATDTRSRKGESTVIPLSHSQLDAFKELHVIPTINIQSIDQSLDDEVVVISLRGNKQYALRSYELVLTIHEIMSLHEFPFDMQCLNLEFCLQGFTKDNFDLTCHQIDIKCDIKMCNVAEDWQLCQPTVSKVSSFRTTLAIRCTRKWWFVVFHLTPTPIAFVVLSLLSFAACSADEAGDRLTLIFTLLLCAIANKMVVTR